MKKTVLAVSCLAVSLSAFAQEEPALLENCNLREGPSRESLLLSGLAGDAKGSVYVFSGRDISYQLMSDKEGVVQLSPYQAKGVVTRFCRAYDEELVEVTFTRPDGVVETSWVPSSAIILKNISHSGWASWLDALSQGQTEPPR